MRQLAWLNATPEKAKGDKSETPQLSRLEWRRQSWKPEWESEVPEWVTEALREFYMPEMPPLECGEYLISYLREIGPTVAAGMGADAICESQVHAWQNNTGIRLAPWESRFLRRLSREYLAESNRASKLGCQPPWLAPGEKPEVTSVQAALRALAKL